MNNDCTEVSRDLWDATRPTGTGNTIGKVAHVLVMKWTIEYTGAALGWAEVWYKLRGFVPSRIDCRLDADQVLS